MRATRVHLCPAIKYYVFRAICHLKRRPRQSVNKHNDYNNNYDALTAAWVGISSEGGVRKPRFTNSFLIPTSSTVMCTKMYDVTRNLFPASLPLPYLHQRTMMTRVYRGLRTAWHYGQNASKSSVQKHQTAAIMSVWWDFFFVLRIPMYEFRNY